MLSAPLMDTEGVTSALLAFRVQFVKKQDGKEIAIFNHYTFYCRQQTLKTASWVCTNSHRCKARIVMTNALEPWSRVMKSAKLHHTHPPPTFVIHDVRWVKKRDGKELVIFNQYTFYSHMKSMTTINWSCTSAGCKSRLITTNEDMPSQRFKFIKSVNGRPLILMDNYTYTFASAAHKKGTKRWICTSRSQRDCKAKVILNGDQEIVLAQTDHNHLPPQYFCLNGEYIKVHHAVVRTDSNAEKMPPPNKKRNEH
ncbi:unnamed protein product [Spodoptera exigua]|nr:unnamed protein product [Spodoptera exigua]